MSTTAGLAQILEVLAGTISNINKSRYTSAAGLTVVLYDILLLLSDEVRLVWQTPRKGPVKYCYLINRYVPPVFLIVANYQLAGYRGPLTDTFCKVWISTASITQVLTGICATYILVLRVLALYGRRRYFPIILYALFIVSYGVCLGITIDAVLVIRAQAEYNPTVRVCSIDATPKIFRAIFITPVFFEVLIGILTLWKAVQHAYVLSNAAAAPMLHIMFRDGLFWFTAVVGLRVWNALIWMFLPQSMVYLGIYILWALVSTFVSRFYLNILNAASTGVDAFSTQIASRRKDEQAAARTIGGNHIGLIFNSTTTEMSNFGHSREDNSC